ncbi:MAG TPA: MFS transporter, partial [bacterium]|nr:MFS transporter [bacterium]
MGRGDVRNIVLVISITGSFLTAFLGSSVNVALPLIGKDLSADTVMLTWINTSYLLATTIFLIPFGRLSDIYGRKKIYLYGILVFTISSLLCGLSNSYIFLILTRVLQGIGAGMLFATSTALLTSVFPVGERGKALGLSVTAVYIGLSAGPFLGGILTRCLGWRSIFFSSVFIGVITLLLILLRLKEEWIEAKGEKFNLPESILYSATLAGVIYGFTRLPSITGLFLILLGIIGFLI